MSARNVMKWSQQGVLCNEVSKECYVMKLARNVIHVMSCHEVKKELLYNKVSKDSIVTKSEPAVYSDTHLSCESHIPLLQSDEDLCADFI